MGSYSVNSAGHFESTPLTAAPQQASKASDGRKIYGYAAYLLAGAAALFTGNEIRKELGETQKADAVNFAAAAEEEQARNVLPENDSRLQNLLGTLETELNELCAHPSGTGKDPDDIGINKYGLAGTSENIDAAIAAGVAEYLKDNRDAITAEVTEKYYETINDPSAKRTNGMIIRLVLQDEHIRPEILRQKAMFESLKKNMGGGTEIVGKTQ